LNADRLDILYVGTLPPHTGGSAILAFQMLTGLAILGHSIRAVAPITPEKLRCGDAFAAAHPEIHLNRFLVPYFDSSPNIPPSAAYHLREGEGIRNVLSSLMAQRLPHIMIIGRESFASHVSDVAAEHSIASVMLVQGATTLGILTGSIPETMAERMLTHYRKVDLIIVVAKHLWQRLQPLGFHRMKVIENAVDHERFYPSSRKETLLQALRIPADAIIVAHISNLKALKRPLDVVHSARKALHQNSRLIYLIVGDGAMRNTMEEACRDYQISSSFRFVGWVDYDDIPDYVNLADIVVMPSEAEARALVYLETQACGRVLVASDIPAAREVIIDKETGLLFPNGDVDGLAAKTLLAANDSTLRVEIGRRARESVLAWRMKDLVNAYEATLKHVVMQHQASKTLFTASETGKDKLT
jgi:glycosyltransferase involved in cell wall biosynthesis